jgi:hypothetical protein
MREPIIGLTFMIFLFGCQAEPTPDNGNGVGTVKGAEFQSCKESVAATRSLQKPLNSFQKGVFYAFYCQ